MKRALQLGSIILALASVPPLTSAEAQQSKVVVTATARPATGGNVSTAIPSRPSPTQSTTVEVVTAPVRTPSAVAEEANDMLERFVT